MTKIWLQYTPEKLINIVREKLQVKEGESLLEVLDNLLDERIQLSLLLFQPIGASHHDANKCPYCKENLNGK